MNALPAQSTMNRSQPIRKTRFGDRNNTPLQSIFSQNESRRYREQQRAPQVIFVLPPPAQNEVIEKRHSLIKKLTEDEVANIERNYVIQERENTLNFMVENKFLLALLGECAQEIRKRFGQKTTLVLRMALNPDGEERELFIRIQTPLPFAEAFPLLERVDEEWWLDNASKANGKLELILEYI